MVRSTSIYRVTDSLPLAASVDDEKAENDLADQKHQAKLVVRKLNLNSVPRASIESGNYVIHYLIDTSVCYLCICDQSFSRKLAFSYLEDLAKDFQANHGSECLQPGIRPYAFVQFDNNIQKLQRAFVAPKAASNLDQLHADLQDVTRVMTKNIEDLLYRGDSLDRMSDLSSNLRDESLSYRRAARRINLEAMWKQYGPIGIVGIIFVLFLYFKFFY